MIRIGYTSKTYPDKRNIINKTRNDYIYLNKKHSPYFLFCYFKYKLGIIGLWDFLSFGKLYSKKCDIIHSFNNVIESNIPTITTFESCIPRNTFTLERRWERSGEKIEIDKNTYKALNSLADDNYKYIIAISQSAYNIQKYMLSCFKINDQLKESIIKKMVVIPPPQKLHVSLKEVERKFSSHKQEKIKFIFVGNNYFRKGGKEIVEILNDLYRQGFTNFELVLISNFSDSNSLGDINEALVKKHLKLLENSTFIKYYSNVNNKKVIELMKEAHIGLLPTLADTYGFSVLEMQSCGVPVISTNIRSLTEINSIETGWLINVPVHPLSKESYHQNVEEVSNLRKEIAIQLKQILMEIFEYENFNVIKQKSFKSLERVKKYHNEESYKEKLEMLYRNIL